MSQRTDNLELLLTKLGQASREGALVSEAGRYPWRTVEPEVIPLTNRRFAWVRMMVPLAAAAAVAVLFVGPALWNPQAAQDLADNVHAGGSFAEPERPVETPQQPVAQDADVNCDYNNDGVVDGKDIQAWIDSRRGTEGDWTQEVEQFKRCLLGQ